ncbi:MAG: TolB family protein [Planctomycetaceae bacterium]
MRSALLSALLLGVGCAASESVRVDPLPGERRLAGLRQLTFGGENAEAYWSFDFTRLIFQSTRPPFIADQIFTMRDDGSRQRLVSTGKGRTTCAYYLPGDERILYASTHGSGDAPPPPPDRSQGYVWPIFEAYEIYLADADGGNPVNLTRSPGYDAEATVSPQGDRIVFTSTRDGDLDLYSMKLDGSDVRRLTDRPGYDGGAFYSWDGKKIVWRAPAADDDVTQGDYAALLARGLVRPSRLEIWVMDADGTNKRQVTRSGKASFAPFWHPDNRRIIFSSNLGDPKGRNFDLYLISEDGTGLERVTFFERAGDDFDGFPMFDRAGKRLVFCSNRGNARPNETNVFVAEWQEGLP